MERKLTPLTDESVIYTRPDGWHYHLSRECPMLQGGDFKRLGYRQIKATEVRTRRLNPCVCCYAHFKPHKRRQKMSKKPTAETAKGLKPYDRNIYTAHNTEDEIFKLGQIEGRNQVLYLLLAIGDENVAHDHFHPEIAEILLDARRKIVFRLRHEGRKFPDKYPDFEAYTYTSG
jgi:hypothetical protein